jgi:CRISPR-associated protein Csb2
MIAIGMKFLVGRFHATPWGHHVNEGALEYPPSLWRLLRSLVACFHRTKPENVREENLQKILDALASESPSFVLPKAATAHTRHYDQANGGVKFFDNFVALQPDSEIVWLWQTAELEEKERDALQILLKNLNTFGRSESWCEAYLMSDAETQKYLENAERINGKPFAVGESLRGKETLRLLAPRPHLRGEELLKALSVETGQMRKEKKLEPDGAFYETYTRPNDIFAAPKMPKRKPKKSNRKYQVARFALQSNVLPRVQDALVFAELARRRLIKERCDNGHSETIVGKLKDGTPLEGHLHAHYIPTDEDDDGRIDHLTVYAPIGFNTGDVDALGNLTTINWRESRIGIRTLLVGLGAREDFAHLELFKRAKKFRSVTPFLLPFFATRGAGKRPRPKDLPEVQLRRELRSRSLPEPIKITPIDFHKPNQRGEIRWYEFHRRRFDETTGHGTCGFEIEFAEEDLEKLAPPIALGFACHFGMGLFLPVEEK